MSCPSPHRSLSGASPQDAGLLRGELLLGEDSLLLEGRQLLQLSNRIGRGSGLFGRSLLGFGLLTARQANDDRAARHRADQSRAAISHKWA